MGIKLVGESRLIWTGPLIWTTPRLAGRKEQTFVFNAQKYSIWYFYQILFEKMTSPISIKKREECFENVVVCYKLGSTGNKVQ